MQIVILSHNFNYLYIQISNLIEKNIDWVKVYKISKNKIIEYPIEYFNLDDISLFKKCINVSKSRGELYELSRFTLRIFRIIKEFKLLFDKIF